MNSHRFIANFTNATTMLGPWEYEGPNVDKSELDEFALRSSRLWWRREAVDGMDSASFRKLTASQRQELERLRQVFLNTFQGTEDHRERVLSARDALVGIHRLIGEQVTSLECMTVAHVLTDIIRDEKYHGWFLGYSMEFGSGWNGDPVIWVVLIVHDHLADDLGFRREYPKLHQMIHDELRMKGIGDQKVVMSVRTIGEQEQQLQLIQQTGMAA